MKETDEVLINVGRQEFSKGQEHLVSAMGFLVKTRPSAVLLIVGRGGSTTSRLESMCQELGLGDRVRFVGHRDDVPDLLAASDVFVTASLWEGLPGVVLEAMAIGLPVVASDIPAHQEIFEEGGCAVLVPPGRSSELAAAVEDILDKPERAREIGERNRQLFESRFTIQKSTGKMVELYKMLLQGQLKDGTPAGIAKVKRGDSTEGCGRG